MGLTAGLEVENATFKVHRSFLTKYSTVIKDMLEAPQSESGRQKEATDENPLILKGDSASGWEMLLESQYDWWAGTISLILSPMDTDTNAD